MAVAAFAAGAVVALLALRLLLGVINYIASRRRSNVSTVIVLGSGECRFALPFSSQAGLGKL
jgi:hypothetical protein